MNIVVLQLAIEQLSRDVELLKQENVRLNLEVKELKEKHLTPAPIPVRSEPELLDTKQVLAYLGVCYNTLQAIIRKGLIQPIRINQRRIRFSKQAVLNFLSAQS